jgi:DNA-binding beta-propeller fold protein YncE
VIFNNDVSIPVTKLELYFNGSKKYEITPADGEISHEFLVDTTLFTDGPYTVTAKVYNSGGSKESDPINVFIDNTPPVVVPPVNPAPDATITSKFVSITVNATDFANGSGINLPLTLIEVEGFKPVLPTDIVTGPDNSVKFTYPISLIGGKHNVKISFQDRAGNETVYEWQFTTDMSKLFQAYIPMFLKNNVNNISELGYTPYFRFVSSLGLPDNPDDTSITNDEKLFVSLSPGEDKIDWFVDYPDPHSGDNLMRKDKEKSTMNMPDSAQLSPDGKYVYVSNKLSGNISIMAMIDGSKTADIPVGIAPGKMALTANGYNLYVPLEGEDRIVALNFDGPLAPVSIPLLPGSRPQAVALNPASDEFLFAANTDLNEVSVIYLRDKQPRLDMTFTTCSRPVDIKVDPQGKYLWVVCQGSGEIEVYKVDDLSLIKIFSVRDPYRIDFNGNGELAFIRRADSNAVTVIYTPNMINTGTF